MGGTAGVEGEGWGGKEKIRLKLKLLPALAF